MRLRFNLIRPSSRGQGTARERISRPYSSDQLRNERHAEDRQRLERSSDDSTDEDQSSGDGDDDDPNAVRLRLKPREEHCSSLLPQVQPLVPLAVFAGTFYFFTFKVNWQLALRQIPAHCTIQVQSTRMLRVRPAVRVSVGLS